MEPETFCERIELLMKRRYPVLKLEDALHLLDKDSLPPCSVVLTFDDGFYSIYRHAIPVLMKRGLPSTIFVTTYYSVRQNPIFRLVVQYMFWKTSAKHIDLSRLAILTSKRISIHSKEERDKIAWQIINYAETELEEDDRCHIARELGSRLGVPYEDIVKSRVFSIMDAWEITRIAADDIDIQLHSHRHSLPENRISVCREINDNRSVLEPLVGHPLSHFCYPSGLWSEKDFTLLKNEKIESAMTCDPGLNYSDTPRLALRRFLDGQHVSEIEFEGELSGFTEMLRKIRAIVQKDTCKFHHT